MLQDLDLGRPLGSEMKEPQVIGDVLNEMLQSNSPLAKGYRKHIARKEIRAEKGDNV